MKPNELFETIKTIEYSKIGYDFDYAIRGNIKKKRIEVYFQQSASKQDWRVNLDRRIEIFTFKIGGREVAVKIPRGYLMAWLTARFQVLDVIKRISNRYPDWSILTTGWSYGGAEALIAALDIFGTFNKAPLVVTFGAPGVFYDHFATALFMDCCRMCYQFINRNDIICRVFPETKHVNPIWVGDKVSPFKLANPWIYHTSYDKIEYGDTYDIF